MLNFERMSFFPVKILLTGHQSELLEQREEGILQRMMSNVHCTLSSMFKIKFKKSVVGMQAEHLTMDGGEG